MRKVTKPRPRTKPPEERRDELMSAAERLFLKQGVQDTTVEQITRAAGVAKGTYYLYFATKEDVRAALGDRFAQRHLERVKAAIAEQPADDWKALLTTWAQATVDFYLDSIQLHDMLFYESRSPTREGLVDNIVIDHLEKFLAAGAAAGAWPIDDPRSAAVFLFSGVHGVVDDAYTKEKRVNRARVAFRVKRLCLSAVGLAVA
jgi:AcrR family transcriptional regulator